VGAGGSQEASFALRGDVRAGTYHLVLDAVIINPVDVTFDLIWRHGGTDTTLAEWTEHYDPTGDPTFPAQPFEYDEPATGAAPAIKHVSGDELVFRYTASPTSPSGESYIPNGDGAFTHGRIPNIRLP
jgi:hypothetical protein